jgi:hypothetical protein
MLGVTVQSQCVCVCLSWCGGCEVDWPCNPDTTFLALGLRLPLPPQAMNAEFEGAFYASVQRWVPK